jgi:hypothetical protein
MLAHLVANLAKTKDGDGTLLDHSIVLFGSNMGNSNQHVHYDVAARPDRRGQRQAERLAASGLSIEDDPDGQPAPERARQVRHSSGQHRRQYGEIGKLVGIRIQVSGIRAGPGIRPRPLSGQP